MLLRTLNAILLRRTCPAAACRPAGRNVCVQAAPLGGSGSGSRGSSGEAQRPSENRGGAAGPPGGRRRPSGAPNTKDSNGSSSSGSSSPRSSTSPSFGSPSSPGMQRLAKVMAQAGVASRRACETLIASSVVKVNGKVVTEQGLMVDLSKDKLEVSGKSIDSTPPALLHFAVNKPKGYICSSVEAGAGAGGKAQGGGKRAIDILEPWITAWKVKNKGAKLPPRLYTVGRLDVATTGLIFVTNDGEWAHKVIHPSSELTKEYIVLLDKPANMREISLMGAGVEIDGVAVRPLDISVLEDGVRLRITVSEGKTHEVRLMVASSGREVMSLKRVRVGGFKLPRSLGIGGYKELTSAEIRQVLDSRVQDELVNSLNKPEPQLSPTYKPDEFLEKVKARRNSSNPVPIPEEVPQAPPSRAPRRGNGERW